MSCFLDAPNASESGPASFRGLDDRKPFRPWPWKRCFRAGETRPATTKQEFVNFHDFSFFLGGGEGGTRAGYLHSALGGQVPIGRVLWSRRKCVTGFGGGSMGIGTGLRTSALTIKCGLRLIVRGRPASGIFWAVSIGNEIA